MEEAGNSTQMTGRFYTSARRFKQVLGSLPDGTKIPGGPYTYSQIGIMLAVLAGGWMIRGLWGTSSAIGDIIILLTVAVALGYLVGKLPPSRRNPLKVMGSCLALLTHPGAGGKWRGRGMKLNPKAQKIQRQAKQATREANRERSRRKPTATSTAPENFDEPAGYGSSLNRLMADHGLLHTEKRN